MALDAQKQVVLQLGDGAGLSEIADELEAIHRWNDELWLLQFVLFERGYVAVGTARWDEAETRLREALEISRRIGDRGNELLHLSMDDLALYARTGSGLDEPVRRAFARMAELRAEIDRRERRLDELEGRREEIVGEQERIRANLARVPAEGDLHRRYLNRLNAQEDELERLAAETDAAREELDRAREALRAYVAGLEL